MKNTILKIAGVKDEKSFYKKYPTEAAFLKAHPKAKTQLEQFATGGQIAKNIGAGLYGIGEGLLDTITLGATDQLTDMGYDALQKAGGSTQDEINEQNSIHGYSQAAGAVGGGFLNPAGVGAGIKEAGEGLAQGISQGNKDKQWAQDAGKVLNFAGGIGGMAYGNFGSAGGAGALQSAKFAGSDFGKFANNAGKYSNMTSQVFFNQRRAMGGIQQYAMGGFNDPNDPPVSMSVNPNNPQMSMSINKVNTNPYESSPGYKAAEAAKFFSSTGSLYSPGAARGMNPKRLIQEYNSNEINPNKEKGSLKYISGNMNNGTALFQKTDSNGKTSDYYYAKGKDGSTALYPALKNQVNNTQVNPQVNPQINPVNNIQNTTQANTQPENRGEYTNFGQPYTSVKFKGAHGYSGNDVTYKYYDPATNKEINQDLNKSFDSKGNYIPSFLEQQSNTNNMPVSTNKYGGLMQYAMGGMNVQPNAEVQGGEIITSDTPPQLFNNGGIRLVSNNPYSDPTYETNGPSHDTINEDGTTGMEVFLKPGTVINGLTKVPAYMANKKGETFDDHMKKHAVGENKIVKLSEQIFKKAQNGDKYSKNTSNLILPILNQKLKEFADYKNYANNVQNAIVANKEQLKAIKRGELPYPSQGNEQMQPQGMPGQYQDKMAIGKYGGMMNYMAMGGRLPKYVEGATAGAPKKIDVNAGSPGGIDSGVGGTGNQGFDWANAGKQVGQFALQNVGNLYDLNRSTQDNSQLSLSRMTPTFLDKTSDLATNQRMYSEGIRDSNAVAQGNPNTWANDRAANRATKLNNDLRINTTYGNLNAEIDNTAKLYNAGAIDRETMFKLQSEAANRNLQGESLGKIGQNIMNQNVTNDKNSMDQKTLDIFRNNINDPTFLKYLSNFKTGTV